MGVTGSGKTSIGAIVSERLGYDFIDADDYHPQENIQKMSLGEPLDDSDRLPWLREINNKVKASPRSIVLACSALKESYRRILLDGIDKYIVIHLKGSPELIVERIRSRQGHFAHEGILKSQFQDIEAPENAIVIDVSLSPDSIAWEIQRQLNVL